MSLSQICERYFETFSNRDISGLESMFSENIYLRDWKIEAKGKVKVLEANQKIFDIPVKIFLISVCIGTNGRMSVPSNREHHYRNLRDR